jgi:predicted acyl esterase
VGEPAIPNSSAALRNVMITEPDTVKLATDVYLPARNDCRGALPFLGYRGTNTV